MNANTSAYTQVYTSTSSRESNHNARISGKAYVTTKSKKEILPKQPPSNEVSLVNNIQFPTLFPDTFSIVILIMLYCFR